MMSRYVREINGYYWENEVLVAIRNGKFIVHHTGSTYSLPDVIIDKNRIGIECKNWGIQSDYLVDARDIRTQVLPKYTSTKYAHKILAFKRKMTLSTGAWRLLRKNGLKVTFGLRELLQAINRVLQSPSDPSYNDYWPAVFSNTVLRFSLVIRFLCLPGFRQLRHELQLLFISRRFLAALVDNFSDALSSVAKEVFQIRSDWRKISRNRWR